MALYVAVCLLAGLLALSETVDAHRHLIASIWGITIGLALAHFFAFRVSARLIGAGTVHAHDVESGTAQLVGAAVVAALASVPVMVLPADLRYRGAEYVLAGFIAYMGFVVARRGGARTARAIVYSLLVLSVGLGIAMLKNGLAGH